MAHIFNIFIRESNPWKRSTDTGITTISSQLSCGKLFSRNPLNVFNGLSPNFYVYWFLTTPSNQTGITRMWQEEFYQPILLKRIFAIPYPQLMRFVWILTVKKQFILWAHWKLVISFLQTLSLQNLCSKAIIASRINFYVAEIPFRLTVHLSELINYVNLW